MPTILSFFMTGIFLTRFSAMSLTTSSTLADSHIVITGLVMICFAVMVSGDKHGSTTLLRTSRSDITPTGLSSCTTIIEPILYLFIAATTLCTLESGPTTFTSFVMTSRTRSVVAISCLQPVVEAMFFSLHNGFECKTWKLRDETRIRNLDEWGKEHLGSPRSVAQIHPPLLLLKC